MPLMSMIMEAMTPSIDETYCDLMHRMEADEDRMFFHHMGGEMPYENREPVPTEKVAAKELMERLEKHEETKEEIEGAQEAYINPETQKWDDYFKALEADMDVLPESPEKESGLGGETVESEADENKGDEDPEVDDAPVNDDPLDAVAALGVTPEDDIE